MRWESRSKKISLNELGSHHATGLYTSVLRPTKQRTCDRLKRELSYRQDSKSLGALICVSCALICASILFLIKLLSLIPSQFGGPTMLMPAYQTPITILGQMIQNQTHSSNSWIVNREKCHIPALDPWHISIKSYVRRKPPLNCSAVIENYYESNPDKYNGTKQQLRTRTLSYVRANKLYFTNAAVQLGALRNNTCCYKSIERFQDDDTKLNISNQCIPVHEQGLELAVNNSVIEVECSAINYTNVHALMRHNDEEETALKQVANQKLDKDSYYNVLMLGIDTISRLNGLRQLNQTLELLRNQYETIEFLGYNKVGENTFPNLIPLLTGLKPGQLAHQIQCWQTKSYTEENDKGDDYLDNCKYLWNFYQQLGYVTYFSEDWPGASTFNYLKPGFKREPTTHYGRPFVVARNKLTYPQFEGLGCASCQLDTPIVELDLNNLKSFIKSHNDQPYFAFHWINCPQHDDLNGASTIDHLIKKFFSNIRDLTKLDRTFVIFFSDHGYRWNDFVSTHVGHYESSLPMMTIAPPVKFIKDHPDLYKNIRDHVSVLLTPFDMFKTMLSIRDLGAKKGTTKRKEPIVTRSASNSTTETYPTAVTSIQQIEVLDGSTFKQPFKMLSLIEHHTEEQLDRSCIEAGIPDNYCVCHQFEPIDADSLDVIGASYYLVYVHIGSMLKNYQSICHLLDLEKVHKADMFNFEKFHQNKNKTERRKREQPLEKAKPPRTTTARPKESRVISDFERDIEKRHQYIPNRIYNIVLSTKPGGGLFQEVVRYYGNNMAECNDAVQEAQKFIEDDWAKVEDKYDAIVRMNRVCEFSVHSESISRLNLYKDQSKCVKNNIELKKTCFCK